MSESKERPPVDVHRAVRQFERFLGINPNVPRDDWRLSIQEQQDLLDEEQRQANRDTSGGELIATIHYRPQPDGSIAVEVEHFKAPNVDQPSEISEPQPRK